MTQYVLTPAANGGTACPPDADMKKVSSPCYSGSDCPVDCVMTPWSQYSPCSSPCGGGSQTRTRSILTPAAGAGQACGTITDPQVCNAQACPVDCVGDWGNCVSPSGCGQGTQQYAVFTPANASGKACRDYSYSPVALTGGEKKTCASDSACGVDCVGHWAGATPANLDGWSQCSSQCSNGTKTRSWVVDTPRALTGKECSYSGSLVSALPTSTSCTGAGGAGCSVFTPCSGSWTTTVGACNKACGGGYTEKIFSVSNGSGDGKCTDPLSPGTVRQSGDALRTPCNRTPCCDTITWKPIGSPSTVTSGSTTVNGVVSATGGWVEIPLTKNCSMLDPGGPYREWKRNPVYPAGGTEGADAQSCGFPVAAYVGTAQGCADLGPTSGTCTTGINFDLRNDANGKLIGCTVPSPIASPSGTCNPYEVSYDTARGCNLPTPISPYNGTCSISGVGWSTGGCSIPAAGSVSSVSCSNGGAWNGSSCVPAASIYSTSVQCEHGNFNYTTRTCPSGSWYTNSDSMYGGCNYGDPMREYYDGDIFLYRCTGEGEDDNGPYRWYNTADYLSCPTNYSKYDFTDDSGYQASICKTTTNNISSASCPGTHDLSADKKTCTGKTSTVSAVNCSDSTRYVGSTTNTTNCAARAVDVNTVYCPAGYTGDTTSNKCIAKTASIASLGCQPGYTQNLYTNKCEALDQHTKSLGCKGPWYDPSANLDQNRCIATTYRSPVTYY
jgi:hypothetical protein